MKKAFRPAFTATIPVLCGYLFIGFAFGVMLRDIGFGSIWSFFCSLSIYAGSGQYLLVSLLAAKASLVTVAVMTLLHIWKHNNLLSIGVGTVLYMVLVQNVFV